MFPRGLVRRAGGFRETGDNKGRRQHVWQGLVRLKRSGMSFLWGGSIEGDDQYFERVHGPRAALSLGRDDRGRQGVAGRAGGGWAGCEVMGSAGWRWNGGMEGVGGDWRSGGRRQLFFLLLALGAGATGWQRETGLPACSFAADGGPSL